MKNINTNQFFLNDLNYLLHWFGSLIIKHCMLRN